MPQNIAIVEDEVALAANYRDTLLRQGFRVSLFRDRPSASAAFEQCLPDLAIIDVGLGEEIEGGFDLCRDLRSRCPILPIIILTARDSELDIVSGLRLGANDYLSKSIGQAELQARVIAHLRRAQALRSPVQAEHVIDRGDLMLNEERMTATWQEQPVDLTVNEFRMVHALARWPGQVRTRLQLMDAADTVLDDSSVTSHIKRIRNKFRDVDANFSAIETAYGAGYRWTGR